MAPPVKQRSTTVFRVAAGTFGLAAFAGSLWVMAAEVLAMKDASALPGAQIGVIRGELWTKAALAEAAALPEPSADPAAATPGQRKAIDEVRTLAMRAATHSPTDARIWLLLSRVAADPAQRVEFLKMSYLTGLNDMSLTPLRLTLATRVPAGSDPMLADFTTLEIQTLLRRAPALKDAIGSAYKTANAEGRGMIEKTLETFDRPLLATLRASR